MKSAITYILISIVSIACSFETIEYLSDVIIDARFTLIDDFQGEGKNTESESSNEKADLSDDLYHNKYANDLISTYMEHKGWGFERHDSFTPSDHSKEIYSPPDTL